MYSYITLTFRVVNIVRRTITIMKLFADYEEIFLKWLVSGLGLKLKQ